MMNEESTQQFNAFEQRIIAAITDLRAEMRQQFAGIDQQFVGINTRLGALEQQSVAMNARLSALEQQATARARETTPLWRDIQATVNEIASQLRLVVADLFKTRARVDDLEAEIRHHPPAA